MAKFNKRHYEAIATVMQEARSISPDKSPQSEWVNVVESLSNLFARDNGLFKRDRFERACEPGANVRART